MVALKRKAENLMPVLDMARGFERSPKLKEWGVSFLLSKRAIVRRVSFLGEGTPEKDLTHIPTIQDFPKLTLSAYCRRTDCFS